MSSWVEVYHQKTQIYTIRVSFRTIPHVLEILIQMWEVPVEGKITLKEIAEIHAMLVWLDRKAAMRRRKIWSR
jgi:hypothetical protein